MGIDQKKKEINGLRWITKEKSHFIVQKKEAIKRENGLIGGGCSKTEVSG